MKNKWAQNGLFKQSIASANILGLVCTMLMLLPSCASNSKDGVVFRGAPDEIQEFMVDGLKVIYRPTGPTNHTVVAQLYIRGGLPALPKGTSPGVEQLALQVAAASGPSGISKNQYRREYDRMRIGLAPSVQRDFSVMTLRCVDEHFDRSWEFFSGIITSPSFDDAELSNAKERLVTTVRNRTSVPEAYAEFLADSLFFLGHPYGRKTEATDVPGITKPVLENYYEKLFVKSRLFLVVVGNIGKENLIQKVRASLAKLPQGSYKDPIIPKPKNSDRPYLLVRKPAAGDIPTNYIVARYLAPNQQDSLYYAMRRLTSFVSGTLFREVRIERNLSYAPGASTYYHRTSFGDISISTVLPDSAWRVAKNEAIDFFRDYIIQDRFLKVSPTWITSQYLDEQTAGSQANELGSAEFYTGSWRNMFTVFDRLEEVTAEQLNEAAQRYLRNFTVVIVGNPDAITAEEYIPEEYLKSESSGSAPGAR